MTADLIIKVRQFLKEQGIDYLLVNSTNEFLVEYAPLDENSRYALTGFSGSTGDALISQTDIFLFVDGRYHEQADLEVNKNVVSVVKMNIGESVNAIISQKVKQGSVLGVCAKKNSQGRLEILKTALAKKNVEVKLLDFDGVKKQRIKSKGQSVKIDLEFTGLSADEKFLQISKNIESDAAVLVTNLEEVSYLCNLRDFSANYSSKIHAKCLVQKDFAVVFGDFTAAIGKKFKVLPLDKLEDYFNNLQSVNNVFVDKLSITAYDYGLLEDKAINPGINYLKQMKSVKNEAEIEHYKKCFEKTDLALLATREFIEKNENISEYDIDKFLENSFYKFGAKSLSFRSIVAKDKNSALAHYSKNSKDEILTGGSLVLIDCGAYYEGGLATDCTRVFVKGKPSKMQKTVYTCVLKAFLKAFNKKIKPSTTGFSIDKAARKLLEEIKPKGFVFSHSLGHGIGISVHENPPSLAFSPLAKTPLKPNMCFTIEPGIYKKDFGGVRLENSCYLAEEDGKLIIKSFSDMCFEEKLIDFDMLSSTEKRQLKKFEVK